MRRKACLKDIPCPIDFATKSYLVIAIWTLLYLYCTVFRDSRVMAEIVPEKPTSYLLARIPIWSESSGDRSICSSSIWSFGSLRRIWEPMGIVFCFIRWVLSLSASSVPQPAFAAMGIGLNGRVHPFQISVLRQTSQIQILFQSVSIPFPFPRNLQDPKVWNMTFDRWSFRFHTRGYSRLV